MNSVANDTRYRMPKLTPGQRRLLRRVFERMGESTAPRSVRLERGEIQGACGLERRDPPLVRTHRHRPHAFGRPTGPRYCHLTAHGMAIAKRLPPLPPEEAAPLSPDECRRLLRELADAILREGDTPRTQNLARCAREALLRPDGDGRPDHA